MVPVSTRTMMGLAPEPLEGTETGKEMGPPGSPDRETVPGPEERRVGVDGSTTGLIWMVNLSGLPEMTGLAADWSDVVVAAGLTVKVRVPLAVACALSPL